MVMNDKGTAAVEVCELRHGNKKLKSKLAMQGVLDIRRGGGIQRGDSFRTDVYGGKFLHRNYIYI